MEIVKNFKDLMYPEENKLLLVFILPGLLLF